MYEFYELQSAVFKVVNSKKAEYHKRYGTPKYVKLPYWVYRNLSVTRFIYTETCQDCCPQMLMGLIVCPTNCIENIEDIEVF